MAYAVMVQEFGSNKASMLCRVASDNPPYGIAKAARLKRLNPNAKALRYIKVWIVKIEKETA